MLAGRGWSLSGLRGRALFVVDAAMDESPVGGVRVVLEPLVDPLEVGEARAVDVLVEDAGGDEGRKAHRHHTAIATPGGAAADSIGTVMPSPGLPTERRRPCC